MQTPQPSVEHDEEGVVALRGINSRLIDLAGSRYRCDSFNAEGCRMEEASLRHCRLFAGLGEDILNECCSRFAAVRVESGDSVALQGATCSRFLIVVRGLLQLRRLTAEGREFTVRISRPGDFLGDEGMLGYAEYAVSAVALIDSVVAFCPSGYAREL